MSTSSNKHNRDVIIDGKGRKDEGYSGRQIA